MSREEKHLDPCEDTVCNFCKGGRCNFGGFNLGLECVQLTNTSMDDLRGLANVAWDASPSDWKSLSDTWNTDEIAIGDRIASGKIFLIYCSVMFGRHPIAFGDDIQLREEKRRYFHKLLCLSAGTTHDDEKFQKLLEKKVEEFTGKYRPHELYKYKKKLF